MKIRNQPATMDGATSGMMISLQVRIQLAPELNAASSRLMCTWLKDAAMVRTLMVMYLTR